MQFLLTATAILTLGLLTASGAEPDQPRHFELHAESNAFWNLLDRDAKLTKIGGGFGFTEGPV
jgi:hypothetical protein